MNNHKTLLIAFCTMITGLSHAEKAQDNINHSNLKQDSSAILTGQKMPESYPTPEEISKMMSIHFPKEWKKLAEIKEKNSLRQGQVMIPHRLEVIKSHPTQAGAGQSESHGKPKDTIRVRQISSGPTFSERLSKHRASEIQKLGINTKYSYSPKLYTVLPNEIKDIRLIGRINTTSVGSLRIYSDLSNKYLADAYFQSHQRHSELLSAYIARRITLNNGVIGENVTLNKSFLEELSYKFADTPVLSVRTANQAEKQYLYILLRLTPGDRVQFWKYINTMRVGDLVKLPNGLTIADVLTAEI